MNIQDINKNITEVVGDHLEDVVPSITSAFEIAILHGIVNGQPVELENLGCFSSQDGAIVFKPSVFLESAAKMAGK